ncbi:MAG: DUF5666 domain-containing protein [Woeseiaceae bacterium]|nr:DUF5666 domain-containing protein [Woeseiaceae bacterium]
MNANRSMTLISAAIVIAAAGSSGTASAGIDGSGITKPKPKVTKGPVSGFGSIYVNGVRYDTDTALFIIDGALGSEADLTVGQIVSVLGTVNDDGNSGTAYLVTFEDIVEGPVSSIDVDTNRMTVMGQTVLVDADTVFDLSVPQGSLASLGVNDLVEISGYVDSAGRIVAASVRNGSASAEFELSGVVDSVDGDAMRFSVNGQPVDFNAAGIYGLNGGMPRAGDTVEIVGGGFDASGAFVASRIYAGDAGLSAISGVDAEIEGVITGFHALNVFDLGGTRVRLTWDTRYVNDWIFGLSTDRKVQVSGVLDETGTLVADEVVFEKLAKEKITGTVAAVSGDYLVVGGRLVRVMPETKYKDDSDRDERRFNVGSLSIGDRVEISGHGSHDVLHANLLTRVDDDDEDDDDSDDD